MKRIRSSFVALGAGIATCVALGCSGGGSSSGGGDGNDASVDASQDALPNPPPDATSDSSDGPFIPLDAPPSDGSSKDCENGKICEDGICAGGKCCEAQRACGNVCCDIGSVCSFQKCVVPSGECFDEIDCAYGEYCELSLGKQQDVGDGGVADVGLDGACQGGKLQPKGKCLPRPPACEEGTPIDDDGPLTCLHACQWKPPTSDFSVELKYSWGDPATGDAALGVIMSPIVIQLDDDDCDGRITANDIPEIVFTSIPEGTYFGTVWAISIVDGKVVEKWKTPGLVGQGTQLAAGNIDGKPGNEIVGCTNSSHGPVALDAEGKVLWTGEKGLRCNIPAIADLDGDGKPEVIVEGGVVDGATGKTKFKLPVDSITYWIAADLDGDGKQELVGGKSVMSFDGQLLATTGRDAHHVGIGDFDLDGKPEIVSVNPPTHSLWIWRYDPTSPDKFVWVRKEPVDIKSTLDSSLCPAGSAGNRHGGGPITIADFNGDGVPDVALAAGVGYVVLDGKKLVDPAVPGNSTHLWAAPTHDCTSAATGSSVFDFNGDGKAEVIYSDEIYFRIYDGLSGDVLFQTCNTTGTAYEFPLVADVDNDGHAEIVVVSNTLLSDYVLCEGTKQSGVRIFGSKSDTWVRTRRVWNQHPYSITNVEEDGTIPKQPLQNWKQPGLNNFRQNKQPGGEFAAPDAVVSIAMVCQAPGKLVATVRNVGEASLPAGLMVTFYRGESGKGKVLAKVKTTAPLYSAQSQIVHWDIDKANEDLLRGTAPVYASVQVPADVHECREENNTSKPLQEACPGIK